MTLALSGIFLATALCISFLAFRNCGPFGISYRLSYELWSAPCAGTPKRRVALWLDRHKNEIAYAARKFRIDDRAIAGAIAYEALFNFHPSNVWGLTRSEAPGKVHYKQYLFSEGYPVARQIEEMGYLPRQTQQSRRNMLKDNSNAILYVVAAIERALGDELRPRIRDVACRPGLLVTLYTGWNLDSAHLLSIEDPRAFRFNAAGAWVTANASFLTRALHQNVRSGNGDPDCTEMTRRFTIQDSYGG